MAVPGWVWVVLLVTAITITIRFLIMKSRETGGTSQPMLTTDQIIKQTGFDELGATTTTSSTDASGAMTTTTTDSTGKTMSVTTSKDGSTTQTTVKDKDGTVLADNKSSALDVIKTVAPTLLANIAAGVARDLVIIGGAKIISKASKEVAEKGVKSALQQGGKMVSRQGPELAMKFLGYVTKNSADKAAQAAAETGLRKAAKEAADKVAEAELKRLGKKAVSEITDKAAKEALEKAMEKAGKEAAEKAASEAAQKVASKAATTASEKAAAKLAGAAAAKIGAKAGMAAAKMGAKAGMGPVGIALMAFDVLSMALDVACCGGYCEAADTKTWEKQRDTFNGQVKAMVDDANESGIDPVRWPIITGPFDKLDAVTLQTRLMDKIRAAMADPENKYVKDVVAKLKTAVEAKTITDESQVDAFIDENIDLEGLLMDSTKAICTDLKGKLIMDGEKFAGCSWPDQAQCEASFKWPILEGNENDIYSIWNKEKQECNKDPVSQNMRGICEATKAFPYNKDTKICDLNETYCKQKGMKWDGKNCKLEKGQEIAEMMFGTTVVRGLNALYSADQYDPCPPGARPAGEIAALGALAGGPLVGAYLGQTMCASDKCPDGQDRVSGLCYDPCKTGYDDKSDGITGMKVQGMCYKCPDGFKKTTAGMCERIACPPGQERGSGLGVGFCYKKCSDLFGAEYTESDGATICKKPCPAGMVQEALTCRRNAETKTSASAQKTCPAGWSQTVAGPGGMCQQDCGAGQKKYGGVCYDNNVNTSLLVKVPNLSPCPSGQRDVAGSCWGETGHVGCCWISCSPVQGIKTRLDQRTQSCPAGYDLRAGMCYAKSSVPQNKSLTEVGQCNDPAKKEAAGGMCYEPCSNFGASFKRSAVGLCQMDVMVTERTKTRAPEGPFLVAKPADQYSREPLGISYKVFPKKRKVPFGKGPNGC